MKRQVLLLNLTTSLLAIAPSALPASPTSPTPPTSSTYITPTQGTLTSGFGWRWGRMHQGIDIAASIGTPIRASAEGTVTVAGWNNGGYGNLVEIKHLDGYTTRYAHNNRLLVKVGDVVHQGDMIAEMGSTGRSTGPHCHFEIHVPGKGAVNPIAFISGRPFTVGWATPTL